MFALNNESYLKIGDLSCSITNRTVDSVRGANEYRVVKDRDSRPFDVTCIQTHFHRFASEFVYLASAKLLYQVWCHFTTTNTKPWKINTKHQQIFCVRTPAFLRKSLCCRNLTSTCLLTVVESKLDSVRSFADISLILEDSFFVVRVICVDRMVTSWHFLRLLFLCLCDLGCRIKSLSLL